MPRCRAPGRRPRRPPSRSARHQRAGDAHATSPPSGRRQVAMGVPACSLAKRAAIGVEALALLGTETGQHVGAAQRRLLVRRPPPPSSRARRRTARPSAPGRRKQHDGDALTAPSKESTASRREVLPSPTARAAGAAAGEASLPSFSASSASAWHTIRLQVDGDDAASTRRRSGRDRLGKGLSRKGWALSRAPRRWSPGPRRAGDDHTPRLSLIHNRTPSPAPASTGRRPGRRGRRRGPAAAGAAWREAAREARRVGPGASATGRHLLVGASQPAAAIPRPLVTEPGEVLEEATQPCHVLAVAEHGRQRGPRPALRTRSAWRAFARQVGHRRVEHGARRQLVEEGLAKRFSGGGRAASSFCSSARRRSGRGAGSLRGLHDTSSCSDKGARGRWWSPGCRVQHTLRCGRLATCTCPEGPTRAKPRVAGVDGERRCPPPPRCSRGGHQRLPPGACLAASTMTSPPPAPVGAAPLAPPP